MDGVLFLLSVIGIGMIMWWMSQNDRIAADKPTHGLLAMRDGVAARRKKRNRNVPPTLLPEGNTPATDQFGRSLPASPRR